MSSATLELIITLQNQATAQAAALSGQLQGIQTQAQAVGATDPWKGIQQTAAAQTAIETLGGRVDGLLRQVDTFKDTHPTLKFEDNVDAVQTQLKYLQDTLKDLSTKPATVEVKAETSQVRAQLAAVQRDWATIKAEADLPLTPKVNAAPAVEQLDLIKGAAMGVNSEIGMLAAGGGLLMLGMVAVTAFKEAVGGAIEWNTTLNQVQGNTTLTNAQMGQLATSVHDMVASTNADMNQLADGEVHATNLGFGLADSQAIADAAFKSSASTGAALGNTMNAVASVMKEYDQHAGEAAKTTDLLHNAAAQGNMTMEQFVDAGGKTIATAANLGDKLDDVSAAYAALTRHGEDAAMAGTNITGMLVHIVAPSSAARSEIEALSKATGVDLVSDFSQAGLQAKGLSGIMADIATATQGDSSEILKLIPALRGGQGALVLAGTGAKDFSDILASQADIISGKATPTQDAFARTTHTTGYELGVATNQAKLFSLSIGDEVVNAVTLAAQGITHLNDTINILSQGLGDNSARSKQFYDDLAALGAKQREAAAAADLQVAAARSTSDALAMMGAGYHETSAQVAAATKVMSDSLLSLSDDSSKSMRSIGGSLEGMAKETSGSSANAAKGITDFMELIRTMPDTLSPDMEKMRQDMVTKFQAIKEAGGASAQDLNTLYVGYIQQMAASSDFETRQMGVQMLADLEVTHQASAAKAGEIGMDYMATLTDQISAGMPAFGALLQGILKVSDQQEAMGLIGGAMGRKFRIELMAEMAAGLVKIQTTLLDSPFLQGMAPQLTASFNDVVNKFKAGAQSMAVDEGLIGDHIGKTIEQVQAEAAAAVRAADSQAAALAAHQRALDSHAAAVANHAASVAKSEASAATAATVSADQMIKDLGRAEVATTDSTKTIAQAYQDMIPILTEKLPAGMEWLQTGYKQMLDQITSSTPPSLEQVGAQFQAWNEKLLNSNNATWRLMAQSNKDAYDQALAAAQQHTADLLAAAQKQKDGILDKLTSLVDDASKPGASMGGLMQKELDLMQAATAAGLPQVAATIQQWFDAQKSGATVDTAQMVATVTDLYKQLVANGDQEGAALAQVWKEHEQAITDAAQATALAQQKAAQDWATTNGAMLAKTVDDEAKAQQAIVDANKQANDQLAALMAARVSAQQGLASGLGSASKGLFGGDVLAAAQSLGPLVKAALDAGMPQVAASLQGWMTQAAQGGTLPLQEMIPQIQAALQQLAQSADPMTAILAQQAQAALQAAAAAASYTGAIQQAQTALSGLQDVAKQAQAELTADSKLVQDQSAVVQGLQTAWNDAKSAIQGYQSAKLQGEGAANAQTQAAGYTADKAQLGLLQAEQAGLTGAALKPYQDAVSAANLQLQVLQQQAKVTYQPLHDQLTAAAQAAQGLNKELSFSDALKGIETQGAAMTKLGPQIAGATKQLDILKESQANAQAAVTAANTAVATQQAALQTLQTAQAAAAAGTGAVATGMAAVNASLSGTATATATVVPALQSMLGGMGASLDAQMVESNKQSLWGKWWGPSGLLGVMLARLGNTGQSGVAGGGFSFVPNVIASFRGLLETQIPDQFTTNMPVIEGIWTQGLNSMKADGLAWVPEMADVGTQMMQGVAGKITEATPFVAEAATAAVNAAIAAAKAAAGIASPSRRWADEVGLPMAQGAAQGLTAGGAALKAAGQAIVNGALPTVPGGAFAGVGAGVGTFAPTIYVSVNGGPYQAGAGTATLTPGALAETASLERRMRRQGNP